MVIDDKLVRAQPEFAAEQAVLAAQHVDDDAAYRAQHQAREAAKAALAAALAALPELRQQFLYAAVGIEKELARQAIMDCEDKVALAEAARDAAWNQMLDIRQETANAMIPICTNRLAELEPQLLPMLARYLALQEAAGAAAQTLRYVVSDRGALRRRAEDRALEQAQQREMELRRASAQFDRDQAHKAYAS